MTPYDFLCLLLVAGVCFRAGCAIVYRDRLNLILLAIAVPLAWLIYYFMLPTFKVAL